MCMVDGAYDGPNEFSRTTQHTARKEHRCGECHRTIYPGERYTYASWKFDGDFSSAKMCRHCSVAADWLNENCGGFLISGIREDIQQHVSDYRGDAACVPRLKRIDVGMRRKWKVGYGAKRGQLMPIPQMPAQIEPKHAHHLVSL